MRKFASVAACRRICFADDRLERLRRWNGLFIGVRTCNSRRFRGARELY
jgi:hypothetical protein